MSFAQYVAENAEDTSQIDHDYLDRLIRMPMSMLEKEQASLDAALSSTQTAEKTLAAKHSADFVVSKHSMNNLSDMMRELQQISVDAVEVSLATPKLPEKAYTVLHSLLSNEFVVYEQIDQIQELLSLPELVRDSVLHSDFTMALDLSAVADRLGVRFPHSELIQQVRKDVRKSITGMEDILRKSLRQAIRLPQLTRAVSYLRRMQTADLETVFIESRWQFLKSQWEIIPEQLKQTQPLAYLKRVVEIYREHVFATINGFQTIFKHDSDGSDNVAVSKFARNSLNMLLVLLRNHAPRVEDQGDRASLWLQLAFCAQSLGRIECDFWPFLDAEILTRQEWLEATQYQQNMAKRASRAK